MANEEKLFYISELINSNKEEAARNELIKYLDTVKKPYNPCINHLIKQVGLYPYLDMETSNWKDQFVHEIFKVNTGANELQTLHREQGFVLKKLLEGENIALSAPTSFGKSFIIDSLIAIKKPNIIVILVPTIALMDETRRRLSSKFSDEYKLITIPDEDVVKKTIFIFPQERFFSYEEQLQTIDLFIVDEFYKVSKNFDNTRSDILLNAVMRASKKAKQKYYLCPNITSIEESPFTSDINFIKELDFNTVFSNIINEYSDIVGSKEEKKIKKSAKLRKIIQQIDKEKTLIYAGSYPAINEICSILAKSRTSTQSSILSEFSLWLKKNYSQDYILSDYVMKQIGIHNGKLHRSLSQIQTKLFEMDDSLQFLVTTSSMIEGVNTCATNVIMWQRKNGAPLLKYMDFKNLIGRSGRMFKHFVGNIYLLDKPIPDEKIQLELDYSSNIQADIDTTEYEEYLKEKDITNIVTLQNKLREILGSKKASKVLKENTIQTSNWNLIINLAEDMKNNPASWKCLKFLNSKNEEEWDSPLKKIVIQSRLFNNSGIDRNVIINFVKILAKSKDLSLYEQLKQMKTYHITVESYFDLEKKVTFNLATLVHDINTLINIIIPALHCDVSSFARNISFAFLNPNIYYLEEYGVPRMVSAKISNSGIISFEQDKLSLVLTDLVEHKKEIYAIKQFDSFDLKILDWFYEGIEKK